MNNNIVSKIRNIPVENLSLEDKRNIGCLVAIFSFIPGLGHVIQRRYIAGFLWFVAVSIGYCFVIPGLVLHFLCLGHAIVKFKLTKEEEQTLRTHRQALIFQPKPKSAANQKRQDEIIERIKVADANREKIALEYYERHNIATRKIPKGIDVLWLEKPVIISFRYTSMETEDKLRTIGAYLIYSDGYNKFIQGYCFWRNDERTFKLERIDGHIRDLKDNKTYSPDWWVSQMVCSATED